MDKIISTQIIILHKVPYLAQGLIITGLTPDQGVVKLLLSRGRVKNTGLQGHIDLFQIMNIDFKPNDNHEKLIKPSSIEVTKYYQDIAKRYDCFIMANKIAKFIYCNIQSGLSHKLLYQSLDIALSRLGDQNLSNDTAKFCAATSVILTLLQEEGLLPKYTNYDSQKRIDLILDIAQSIDRSPSIIESNNWEQIFNWAVELSINSEIKFID